MRIMNLTTLNDYEGELTEQEKAVGTIGKYLRDIRRFYVWLGENKEINKARVMEYKEHLKETYAASTANSMLVALNAYFSYLGWNECRVKTVRVQKQLFLNKDKELTWGEYHRLINTARDRGDERLALIIETIGSCGIRISELEMITAEAVQTGAAKVRSKGKIREVSLVKNLRKKLDAYCKKNGVREGSIFVTKNGNPLNRSYIWRQMKELGKKAGVRAGKVFPHNLRHFFARIFWKKNKDICYLADILGHSNINTTRIYTATTREQHVRRLEKLELVENDETKPGDV